MTDHIQDSDDSAEAAIGYTNEFFDAAVSKIDATFGSGFAKANPGLVGALVQASSTNLNAFMTAAMSMDPGMFADLPPEPAPPPKSGNRRDWRR